MKFLKLLFTAVIFLLTQNLRAQHAGVDRVVDSLARTANFNGAVLIAEKGIVKYRKYTGLANRHYDIPFSDKTRFHIYSVTKTFTAALIMQLYEQGKIDLDATIATYYPGYKGEAAHKATIRNLLTYSSGRFNKDISSPEFIHEAYDNTIWDLDTFINTFLSEKLIDTPGTKFNYNNGDYILLGKIIENIYHQPYDKVLEEKILKPLRMRNTDFLHHNDIIKNLDEGYAGDDSDLHQLHMPTNVYTDNLYAAGAMYSTPEDLLAFDQAIFNHQLLKAATTDTMLKSYAALGDVAFGFWVYPKKFGRQNTIFAERQGEGYGHRATWVHLIDRNLTVIILANTNTVDLNKMRETVIMAYLGE